MLHLPAEKRDLKIKPKILQKSGYIPAVVYGPKILPMPLQVNYKKFFDAYEKAGETTLIALDLDKEDSKSAEGEEKNVVLIRDVQTHPFKNEFVHVDFYQLPLDQKIEVSVPVESINEAPAVKEHGGILVHNLHEIEIKALPKNLIHEITVDLSSLENIGDSIQIKDITVSEGVEILADSEEVVFAIEEPREEDIEEKVSEEEAIEGIKTEVEEKREAEDAEGAEATKEERPLAREKER
jgi:large subunit ribosomal protein L25